MMAKAYLFYNPLAGQGQILEDLDALEFVLDTETVLCDMTQPHTYAQTLFSMEPEDILVLGGGDGTLNRFVNILEDVPRPNEIYYYPAGEQNAFALDYGRRNGCNPFPVTDALAHLPRVRIGGREGYFLTGVVFSASKFHGFSRKRQVYTEENRPVGVKVSVDRALQHYASVRFLSVMQGRYCQGGLIPDPTRRRTDETLSLVVIHGCGRVKTNHLLRQLRKGRLPKSRHLTLLRGRDVRLAFDAPVSLSTDGERRNGVTEVAARGKNTKW